MALVLYNSYSKKEEPFEPREKGRVSMYTCGPTVYGRPHIGNYSSFLMADLLRRWLEQKGYVVTHVKNITDVGHLVADQDHGKDKIEEQAKKEKTDPLAIARKYTEQYLEDEQALNFLEPFARPRATETIQEMIAIIETLVSKDHAYETDDGVYFSVETFPAYGKLSGNTLDKLDAGSRVKVNEEKKHPADFALWKKTVGENAHHLLRWPSPWGEGFPGWHIECSAMAKKLLGEQIDLHTGGEDNIFPHHESEIAQSECSGEKPFVRYWLHKRRMEITKEDGVSQKMSKSLGNVYTLPDVIDQGYDPLDLRYYLLSVHYRTNLKFSWRGLDDAKKARKKITEWMKEMKEKEQELLERGGDEENELAMTEMHQWQERFTHAMDGDLNTPGALGTVFDVMAWSRKQSLTLSLAKAISEFIDCVKMTFGCFEASQDDIPAAVQALVSQRDEARRQKDFAASDSLREAIISLGYLVKDTADGQKVQKM